jgi:hypothetical protein
MRMQLQMQAAAAMGMSMAVVEPRGAGIKQQLAFSSCLLP